MPKPGTNPRLNNENYSANLILPSQPKNSEPATTAGFSFITTFGDMKRTQKNILYKEAQIYSKTEKWFVWYSFINPSSGRWQRFKVYEDINRIKDLDEKAEYAEVLRRAINIGLKSGFNPFAERLTVVSKNWTLINGLNYFKQKLDERGLRKRTVQTYQSLIKSMYSKMKAYLLDDIKTINKRHLITFLESFNDSNTSFNNRLTILRLLFNYLIDAEILETNPASKIKSRKESITKHKYFDQSTWEKIRKESDNELLDFILFLYYTGTRPNEARQLKHEHILRDRKLLFVPATISKNKKDGYVPVPEFVINKFHGEGLIFGSSVNHFGNKFMEVKKSLKLSSDYTLYSIKHTRAIHLAQDGATPYSIMTFFRHSSLEMTMKYLRDLGLEINREAADKSREM